MLPIFFSSHLCHPVRLTRLVYVQAIVFCPLLSGLFPFLGLIFKVLLYTVEQLNVFGVSLEVSKQAVSTVLDGCCLGPMSQFEMKTDDQFVIYIASHYFDLYCTVMHVLLEAYNIYIHRYT